MLGPFVAVILNVEITPHWKEILHNIAENSTLKGINLGHDQAQLSEYCTKRQAQCTSKSTHNLTKMHPTVLPYPTY